MLTISRKRCVEMSLRAQRLKHPQKSVFRAILATHRCSSYRAFKLAERVLICRGKAMKCPRCRNFTLVKAGSPVPDFYAQDPLGPTLSVRTPVRYPVHCTHVGCEWHGSVTEYPPGTTPLLFPRVKKE